MCKRRTPRRRKEMELSLLNGQMIQYPGSHIVDMKTPKDRSILYLKITVGSKRRMEKEPMVTVNLYQNGQMIQYLIFHSADTKTMKAYTMTNCLRTTAEVRKRCKRKQRTRMMQMMDKHFLIMHVEAKNLNKR